MSTLDDLFAEISARGWLFNNLYHVNRDDESPLWRANLRRPDGNGDWFTHFAKGPDLATVLETCITEMEHAEYIANQPQTFAIDTTPPPEGKSLLDALGLAKSQPKLIRRI